MDSVEFRGTAGDLERFALQVLRQAVAIEQVSPFERKMTWTVGDKLGFSSAVDLRSGLKLNATRLRWDRPWAFRLCDAATPLKFMLGRGTGPRIVQANGSHHVLGAGVLQVRHAKRAVNTTCEFQGAAEFEHLALEVPPSRLKELLGSAALPLQLEKLLGDTGGYGLHVQPTTPGLARLLDEILYADARGASRQLFLEAKGLELLALVIDELVLASEALSPLSSTDIERLERARRVLCERMESPPSLPTLARHVGINEFKLKAGFRLLFGTSVFGCLRAQRMDQARRLLVRRELSVTEVALRVGYANPSKFAAAFRKHFGIPPSAFR